MPGPRQPGQAEEKLGDEEPRPVAPSDAALQRLYIAQILRFSIFGFFWKKLSWAIKFRIILMSGNTLQWIKCLLITYIVMNEIEMNLNLIYNCFICINVQSWSIVIILSVVSIYYSAVSSYSHTGLVWRFYYGTGTARRRLSSKSPVHYPNSWWVRGGILLNTCYFKKLWRGQED